MGSYRHNIAFRMSALILSVLAIIVLLVGGTILVLWIDMIHNKIRTEGIAQTEKAARAIDQECYFVQTLTEAIANSISREFIGEDTDTANLYQSYQNAKKVLTTASAGLTNSSEAPIQALGFMMVPHKRQLRDIYVITNDQKPKVEENNQFNYTELSRYIVPVQTGKPFWGNAFFSPLGKQDATMCYAVPVYSTSKNNTQEIIGVVYAQVSLPNLQKKLKNDDMWATDLPCLMSEFGQILLHKRKAWMVNETVFSLAAVSEKPDKAKESLLKILNSQEGSTPLNLSPLFEDERLVLHSRCANGWVIAVMRPPNWLSEQILPAFIGGVILILIISGALIFIISFLIRKMTTPLIKLTKAVKKIEEGNFEIELPEYEKDDEIGQLTNSFGSMRIALLQQFEDIKATTAEQERAQGELKAAHKIQHDLLPRFSSQFSKNPRFTIDAYLQVARGVGGDLYDFFMLDNDTLVLAIGDVAGKGIPASIFMGVTQTLHRALSLHERNPATLVSKMNQHLEKDNATMMFVTYFYAVINLQTGEMTYTNAGHNKPWILRSNGILECLSTVHGPPLGIVSGNYSSSTYILQPKDILFLHTDGVTESFNAQEEQFGDNRLIQALQTPDAGMNPSTCICCVCEALVKFVGQANQSDDIAMLTFSLK